MDGALTQEQADLAKAEQAFRDYLISQQPTYEAQLAAAVDGKSHHPGRRLTCCWRTSRRAGMGGHGLMIPGMGRGGDDHGGGFPGGMDGGRGGMGGGRGHGRGGLQGCHRRAATSHKAATRARFSRRPASSSFGSCANRWEPRSAAILRLVLHIRQDGGAPRQVCKLIPRLRRYTLVHQIA